MVSVSGAIRLSLLLRISLDLVFIRSWRSSEPDLLRTELQSAQSGGGYLLVRRAFAKEPKLVACPTCSRFYPKARHTHTSPPKLRARSEL